MPSFSNMRIQKNIRIAYSGVCVISIIFFVYPNRFFSAAIPSASTAALLASWIWR